MINQDQLIRYSRQILLSQIDLKGQERLLESKAIILSEDELCSLIDNYDVILDCSDNYKTRLMTNRAAFIKKVPLIFASAIRFEGQLSVFDANKPNSPCYACLFNSDDEIEQDNCSFTGVFSPLVSTVGAMQASEALKIMAGIGESAIGKLLHYNALNFSFYSIKYDRNPCCKICGNS